MTRMLLLLTVTTTAVLAACSPHTSTNTDGNAHPTGQLHIYATTGYIADAVANIAPNARVSTLVGPGGDPHTYQPSTRDIESMLGADLVFWNGLDLELQMLEVFAAIPEKQLAVAKHVPESQLITHPTQHGSATVDPHIWNNPETWIIAVEAIAQKIAEHDAPRADEYARNAAIYVSAIREAHLEAETLLATVASPRILVTGHDAFAYFGETFAFEVHATDFISSEAQLSATELSQLADLISSQQIPVIFYDNQANPQAIQSLEQAVAARGWHVAISHYELYADSLGVKPGVNTYIDVFLHNARAIATELGADQP